LTGWVSLAGGILLILGFLAQGLAFFRSNSQTSDEAVHLAAGYSYLTRGDFRLNPEHPPLIKEICALSVLLAYGIPFQPEERYWRVAEEWRIGRDFLSARPALGRSSRGSSNCFSEPPWSGSRWWSRRLWGDGRHYRQRGGL
jgi:hypothetical protein